ISCSRPVRDRWSRRKVLLSQALNRFRGRAAIQRAAATPAEARHTPDTTFRSERENGAKSPRAAALDLAKVWHDECTFAGGNHGPFERVDGTRRAQRRPPSWPA